MAPEVSVRRRLAAAGLAIVGVCVAAYLTMVQTRAVGSAWDPLFGDGTERVLHSSVTGLLPVPDALLGAIAYAGEAVLLVATGTALGAKWRWLDVLLEIGTIGFAVVGLALVAIQAFVVHHWCTLCLTSAVLSWAILLLMWPEIRAGLARLRRGRSAARHH